MIESKFLYKYDILSPSISILFDTHGCSGKLSVSLFALHGVNNCFLKLIWSPKLLIRKEIDHKRFYYMRGSISIDD